MSHKHQREFTSLVMDFKKRFDLEVDKTSNRHWRLRDPKTGTQAICSSGSGDPFAVRNARQTFERIFGKKGVAPMKPATITNVIVTPSKTNGTPPSTPVQSAPQAPDTSPLPLVSEPVIKARAQPQNWVDAMRLIRETSNATDTGIASLMEMSQSTCSRWNRGFAPHVSRKKDFESLFGADIDFSKLPWGTTGRPKSVKAKQPKTRQKPGPKVASLEPTTVAKDAAYWADVAAISINFLQTLQQKGIRMPDVAAFLSRYGNMG